MVGQRGTLGRVKLRNIALKSRAMSQYGGGMGGGFADKKRFRQTPLQICVFIVVSSFFKKNNVKYSKSQKKNI